MPRGQTPIIVESNIQLYNTIFFTTANNNLL